MIPSPWVGIVIALGVFRIMRLCGWDDWPYAVRLRNWLGGRNERNKGVKVFTTDERGTYTRPTLAKFVSCPWCLGFWVSVVFYVLWLFVPTEVLYGLAPFALSATVGLVAKNWDP